MSGEYRRTPGRLMVIKDAAFYDEGLAGIGVAGDLGERTDVIRAKDSTEAEELALIWAMRLAIDQEAENVDFLSDRNPETRHPGVSALMLFHPGWRIIPVCRRWVWQAHKLAQQAMRA